MLKNRLKNIVCIICFTFACVALQPDRAHALESLKYYEKISTSLIFQIDTYLLEQYDSDSSNYDIASVDLNNDGVLEHILRRKSCDLQKNKCTHLIIAEKKDRILLLSKIRARNLMIDGKFSYGVKNVLAFNSSVNDYDFDIYMWSPRQKLYIMSEQQIKD